MTATPRFTADRRAIARRSTCTSRSLRNSSKVEDKSPGNPTLRALRKQLRNASRKPARPLRAANGSTTQTLAPNAQASPAAANPSTVPPMHNRWYVPKSSGRVDCSRRLGENGAAGCIVLGQRAHGGKGPQPLIPSPRSAGPWLPALPAGVERLGVRKGVELLTLPWLPCGGGGELSRPARLLRRGMGLPTRLCGSAGLRKN